MNKKELSIGFGFALAQNPEAMQTFAALPENRQDEILQKARAVSSKEEMQNLVAQLRI